MFPDFRYLIHGLLGVHPPEWFSLFKTFGFLVALAFIAATWVLVNELRRKEKQGLMRPQIVEESVGNPPTTLELITSGIIGFLLGFKIGGLIGGGWAEAAPNPMGYLLSAQGNVLAGLAGAVLFGWMRYREKKKAELAKPEVQRRKVYPHQRIGEIVVIAALGGLAGAKIFNAFETWDNFLADPIGNLVNSSGLTFYGGFITASIIFYFYAKKLKIKFAHLCDAAAPAIMLAYGIGRLGCQFAGDGDWGIYNSAYLTADDGYSLVAAPPAEFDSLKTRNAAYFLNHNTATLDKVPARYAPGPSWLPTFLVAQNYPHNVNRDGMTIPNCKSDYCAVLPVGVFPTPLYEAIVCIGLFGLMWGIRKRLKWPFHMFAIFLILNGLERFLVELFRVNYRYDLGFIKPTQAEIISTVMVLSGIAILAFYRDSSPDYGDEQQVSIAEGKV